jgi:hypothetical protein
MTVAPSAGRERRPDILEDLEVLAALGYGRDPRLSNAIEFVMSKQDRDGRWRNEFPYELTSWARFERTKVKSKWVTLRACRVLKAAL